MATGDTVMSTNLFLTTLDILHAPFYNRASKTTTLGLIALLEMTGNLPHP